MSIDLRDLVLKQQDLIVKQAELVDDLLTLSLAIGKAMGMHHIKSDPNLALKVQKMLDSHKSMDETRKYLITLVKPVSLRNGNCC